MHINGLSESKSNASCVHRRDMSSKRQLPRIESVNRIASLPLVETGRQYATSIYTTIKNSNPLIQFGLGTMEGGFIMVLDKTIIAVSLIEKPLLIVDGIVCKGLDTVEERVPIVTYPPELIVNMAKDYVSTKFIEPVLKRADSVKQIGLSEATKYSEMAVSRFDNALDAADKYVDKYLPDTGDTTESKDKGESSDSKAVEAMKHVNRLSRKLKRRLTRRTLAEARALKQQSLDTMQCLLYLADLLVKDPKLFMEKMKSVWDKLSEDEPENQVPPANLEQLIAMLTREMARRVVHLTNFTVKKISLIPKYTVFTTEVAAHQIIYILEYMIKVAHLEGGKILAIQTYKAQLTRTNMTLLQLQKIATDILDVVLSQINNTKKEEAIEMEPTTSNSGNMAGSPTINSDTNEMSPASVESPPVNITETPEPVKTQKQNTSVSELPVDSLSTQPTMINNNENSSSETVSNGATPQRN